MFLPDYSFEKAAISKGHKFIAGIDEAGRGPLAGPTTAACVILDPENIPAGLNDSKKLSAKSRERLYEEILATSMVSVASVSARRIDTINIRQAALLAMFRAAMGLEIAADWYLIDGNALPQQLKHKAEFIIKGDAKSLSIAAASIIAKVTRDRMMDRASRLYPGYGFEKHAGYGTPSHLEAIRSLGPCPIHRMTFKPLSNSENAN